MIKKTILIICLIFCSSSLLAGCVTGLVDYKTYTNIISGVQTKTVAGEYGTVSLDELINIKHFTGEVESALYEELMIINSESYKTLAVCFYIKTESDTELNFELFYNGNLIKSVTSNFQQDEIQIVNLYFDDALEVDLGENLVIRVSENIEGVKSEVATNFTFDDLLIFFKE